MADRVLELRRDLSERSAERSVKKYRVIAEAQISALFQGDSPPHLTAVFLKDPAAFG